MTDEKPSSSGRRPFKRGVMITHEPVKGNRRVKTSNRFLTDEREPRIILTVICVCHSYHLTGLPGEQIRAHHQHRRSVTSAHAGLDSG